MKLYATVTSERATKGQGGNEYLHTRYTDETGDEFLTVEIDRGEVVHDEDGTLHRYAVTVKNRNIVLVNRRDHWIREKGEKQKGECTYLTSCIDCKQRLEGTKKRPLDNVQCRACGKVQ